MFGRQAAGVPSPASASETVPFTQVALNRATDIILSIGPKGVLHYANDAACQLLNYSREALLERTIYDLDPNFTSQMGLAHWIDLKQLGPIIFETEFTTRTGDVFPVEVALNYAEIDGEVYPFAFARDITVRNQAVGEIRRLNAELEQRVIQRTAQLEAANRRLAEANQELKDFTSIVSHDLRSPLVNLKGFSDELHQNLDLLRAAFSQAETALKATDQDAVWQVLDSEMPEALHFIQAAVSQMDRLTRAVLNLSRLGRRTLHIKPLATAALVRETLDSLAHQIEASETVVTVHDLPDVMGDEVAMQQIFGNLLSNALLYLKPGRPGHIEIKGHRTGEETTFSIRDNGRGIAAKDQACVFDMFRRFTQSDVPGEGMGLAYVQTLVRRHNGQIRCTSELDKGTTFTFTIAHPVLHSEHHTAHIQGHDSA